MKHDLTRGAYYLCGDKIFNNKLQALHQSMITGFFPKFYYFEQVFRNIDWSRTIEESIDELIAQRAQQLRDRYEYLILSWSGGTDSHTMYQGFVKNNIHIDEILVAYNSQGDELTLRGYPEYAVQWIKQNHPDPTTKITVLDRCNTNHYNYYDSEYWAIDKWSSALSRFEGTMEKEFFYTASIENARGKNYAIVQGYEKPCVRLENGKWYAYFLDCSNFADLVIRDDTEPFFATPDFPKLQVKQAQLLKHNTEIKLAIKKSDLGFWNSRQDHGSKDPLYTYDEHATACGLVPELIENASEVQKLSTRLYWESLKFDILDDLQRTPRNAILFDSLQRGDKSAKNYLNGMKAVFRDKTFHEWLIENSWLRRDSAMSQITGIMSDLFYLGDRTGA